MNSKDYGGYQRRSVTATLPVSLQQQFMERATLRSEFCHWIRGETNRPELRYHVARIDGKETCIISVLTNIARNIETFHFTPESRGIIFTADATMAKKLNAQMNCFVHYGSNHLANSINMEQWKDGIKVGENGRKVKQKWIAATPGLINGIDLDRIDAVIFGEEGMAGLFGGVQGTGRGGRTGHPCMCVFVSTGTFNPKTVDRFALLDDMKRWTQEDICLRLTPSGTMDGKPITCTELQKLYPNTEFCAVCQPKTDIVRLIKKAIDDAEQPSIDASSDLPSSDPLISTDSSSNSSAMGPSTKSSFSSLSSWKAPSYSSHQSSFAAQNPSIGLPVQMNSSLAQNTLFTKLNKTALFSKIITRVLGHCFVCWIIHHRFVPLAQNHRLIVNCGLPDLRRGMSWINFKRQYISLLPAYHFCHGCGFPQNVDHEHFEPSSHNGYGRNCNIPDSAAAMIYALKQVPETWLSISQHFHLDRNMDDGNFANWVGQYIPNSPNYYNGLEILIWFIQNNRL